MTPVKISNIILSGAIISMSLVLSSCSGEPGRNIIQKTKIFMGTTVQVKVSLARGENRKKARDAMDKALGEFAKADNIFSVYKKDSEVSRINRLRKNEKLQISAEAFGLIKKSTEYSARTDGAFDITVKPLVDLWDEAKRLNKLPADEDVKKTLDRIGYQNIVLDKQVLTISFKKDGMGLDFGAVAKGYATDMAVKVLKENGINNAIVRAGGNVYCLGNKSKEETWKVGIQHPRDKNKMFCQVALKDGAIDTSGDYEKYFILGGKRYSHIIDPRTGYPIGDSAVSSTVIASDSSMADALATAFAVLSDKGIATAESIKGVDAIIVFKNNNNFTVKMTDGIKKRYDIFEENI